METYEEILERMKQTFAQQAGYEVEKNSDLELVGGRDNRYNNERNKRAFHSAAVSKESINDNYNTTCRTASYTCCRHQVWLCAG